jgi:protein ImuA
MKPVPPHKQGRPQLDQLRRDIKALDMPCMPALSGELLALAPGLHEVRPEQYLDTPAALSFQIGLLARVLQADEFSRPILWVRPRADRAHDFGRPYPLALIRLGIPPDRVLLVEASNMKDVLWAMEEGLHAGALVFGEVGRTARYDLTASRRLQMSARNRQTIALVQRSHGDIQPSAALTRWRIAATQSPPMPWKGANGLPGLGPPRYRAVLERVRGGPPGNFEIEWKNASLHVLQPAPLAHTTAHSAALQSHRRFG